MKIFYFEITSQHAAPTVVAIFAKSAERASTLSGRLMHTVQQYQPQYRGEGLALFRAAGQRQELVDALASAPEEGLAGYTSGGGWNVVTVPLAINEQASL